MDQCTESCIAVYPTTNFTGSWVFYNTETNKRVRRSRYKLVPDTNLIKAHMDALSGVGKIIRVEVPDIATEDKSPDKEDTDGLLTDKGTTQEGVVKNFFAVGDAEERPEEGAGKEIFT